MNFFEFNQKFPTELACIECFIQIRYQGNVVCRHCGSKKVYHRHDFPKQFDCVNCNNSFSIFKGTILEKSDTDLRKWMYAIYLLLNSKKGISGYQLKREIGVTYKTSWRMLKQIRIAMGNVQDRKFLGDIIEVGEIYIGGKPRKRNKKDNNDNNSGSSSPKEPSRGTKKEALIGVKDRINKFVFSRIIPQNKEGKKLTGKQLLDIMTQVIIQENIMISDKFKGYHILGTKIKHLHPKINDHRLKKGGGMELS